MGGLGTLEESKIYSVFYDPENVRGRVKSCQQIRVKHQTSHKVEQSVGYRGILGELSSAVSQAEVASASATQQRSC